MDNSEQGNKPGFVRFVPYRQEDEKPQKAGLVRVAFPFNSLSDDQRQLLSLLSKAADCMNPVFVHQIFPETKEIAAFLEALSASSDDEELQTKVEDYLIILRMQNSPWSQLPRKNHLLPLSKEKVRKLAEKIGRAGEFHKFRHILFEGQKPSPKANFYPEDITQEELEQLGEEGLQVNTSVMRRGDDGVVAVVNEKRYDEACTEAVRYLKEALPYVNEPTFRLYLEAKIEELRFGTKEARTVADVLWIRHRSPIDIIISTAIEQYQDRWKSVKGSACAAVTIENRQMRELLDKIVTLVPDLEAHAPWRWKRTEIDPSSLPKLKFVDVLSWTGDYVTGPMTTLAQSLPNDEWIRNNIGSVNMVFHNTSEAVYSISTELVAEKVLKAQDYTRYKETLFFGSQFHAALHEIGHTTGRMDPEHQGEPNRYFQEEYSALEEARAELFGMWASDMLAEWGVIDEATALSGHYSMLVSMLYGLKFVPDQAHTKARNMMYHYFLEKGAIERGSGRPAEFTLNTARVGAVVAEMLTLIADIKASGEKERAAALRKQYCFTDELKDEMEERMKDIPLGRALVFPNIPKNGEEDPSYPSFVEQKKFLV